MKENPPIQLRIRTMSQVASEEEIEELSESIVQELIVKGLKVPTEQELERLYEKTCPKKITKRQGKDTKAFATFKKEMLDNE